MYAQGLCKDAKPTKHTQPFTGERGQGDSDNKSEVNFKNRLFLQSVQAVFRLLFLTAIDISGILRYTKAVLILIVQLVCHLLTILTEIYYEKEKNN